MRKFEKISFEQFCVDVCDDRGLYDDIVLPNRATLSSAGYDIRSVIDVVIPSHESRVIKTGIKAMMESDEVLYLYVRSSLGFKYDVVLSNAVGVIDADYYNNISNEGHINIKLYNHGSEDFVVHVGDRVAQGVFMKYLTVSDEEKIKNERNGGFGSTNKEE